MLPGNESLLSLSVVPLLLVVIIIFETSVFPRSVPLLGPVAVGVVVGVVVVAVVVAVVVGVVVGVVVVGVVLTLPGPGPATAGACYADSPDVFRLAEPAIPFFVLLLPVARLREFGPEAVRRQAALAAVAAMAAAGATPGSPGARAPGLRTRAFRHRHFTN